MNRIALFQAFLSLLLAMAEAQPGTPGTNNNQYPYARLSPSMAIVIVVLIAAFFIMGFFSVYIRHCSNPSSGGLVRRALSRRGANRGLDPSVLQTFPTFTYSEVRDHKIGKGALECAVCLNEFEPDDTLRLIPKCDHVFHMECIDAWLESHVTCPVCRADLVPDPDHVSDTASTAPPQLPAEDRLETRSGSDQIAVQVDEVSSSPARSASVRMAKVVFGFGRFRSHSTGHSVGVVQPPGKNLERFTLRLPEQVRKDVMDRALLNRSAVPIFPRGESSRSSRWSSYWRIEREAKSDRWLFFSRGRSVRSPKVVAEAGEASGAGGPTPIKMPQFKFPERKAADETGLFSPELDSHSPV